MDLSDFGFFALLVLFPPLLIALSILCRIRFLKGSKSKFFKVSKAFNLLSIIASVFLNVVLASGFLQIVFQELTQGEGYHPFSDPLFVPLVGVGFVGVLYVPVYCVFMFIFLFQQIRSRCFKSFETGAYMISLFALLASFFNFAQVLAGG